MTTRKRIPGRVYRLEKAQDDNQAITEDYGWHGTPNIDGTVGRTSSKGQTYLARERTKRRD